MTVLFIVLMFLSCQFIGQAEVAIEVESSTINGNDTDDCDFNDCIKKYSELHSYILSNKDLLGNFTEAFYSTGEEPSEFVRITYEFQVCDCNFKNNDTNYEDAYGYDTMEEAAYSNCTNNSSTELYIWSTSALYLLGPDPLFWLTLFAVNIPEASVTIQLPCLCVKSKNELLSRLTYLVRYCLNLY